MTNKTTEAAVRVEHIGRATSGDPALFFHMARLAKANKVVAGVRLFDRSEPAERHDVMNRQRFADVLAAMPAMAILFGNNCGAGLIPALATVGGDATHVTGRLFSREHAGCLKAFAPAETCKPILASKPRLLFKGLSALLASALNAALPAWVIRPRNARLKGVRWSEASPPFVPDLVIVRHDAIGHVPLAPTLLTAKPSGRSAIRADGECTRAYFACFFRHVSTITGTTGVAIAQKQADLFIPQPDKPKPVQPDLLGDAA